MTGKKPNHLIKENSPYLLQHAYNPVNWYPWGSDALKIAREQNKLMVISIGYAACHWCHVMEHESFEDVEVAVTMNRDFVSMKVDREERPDIDHIYMAAAYATTGRGGWPLNVIALPDQRPVFAGTYYSKRDWIRILNYFADQHQIRPEELLQQASEIGEGMKKKHRLPFPADSDSYDISVLHDIFAICEEDLDFVNGGTIGAPKFPMPVNLDYLLTYGTSLQNMKALDYVSLSLDKMAMGGIYDHLGGGFSRYSVDAGWHVPHFEKMLYDNAQLISLYSKSYAATKKYAYKKVVEESIAFIERELTNSQGLFFASLDADSAGTEGAYYAWTTEEIRKYLGDDPGMFLAYYSCEENGNWDYHRNILWKSLNDEDFSAKHDISCDQLSAYIEVHKNQLFTVRSNRTRPATDDKVLTCWNALMITAMIDASKAFDKPIWLEKAIMAANYYRIHLIERNGKLWRNARADSFAISGFLDDYSFLLKSFLDIYQSTLDETWLYSAEFLAKEVMLHFTADDGLFFRLSSDEEPPLIQETIELSDNVIPASNSQMARNLFVLGHLLGREGYILRSEEMLKKMIPQIKCNPLFHANWAMLLADVISGPTEVNIVGDEKLVRLHEFSGHYLPGVIFSGSNKSTLGVGESRQVEGKTLIYVCRDKTCFSPVETVQEVLQILRKKFVSLKPQIPNIMETSKALEILKMAILMEKRGHAFYAKVAEQTPDPDIKHIFLTMADEETKHIKFLSDQYIGYEKNQTFTKVDLPDLESEGFARLILNEDMKTKISSAGFEAAAISAAIDFEKKAVEVYSNQAEVSIDPNEKDLYRWLARWEGGHLKILSDLDNELKEKIWNDNQFWPF